jgi:two-component system, cell cycle response regulator
MIAVGADPCAMSSDPHSASSPRRVLAIDDSEVCRRLLGRQLRRENIEVVEAGDGPSGLSAVRSRPPDLILLDIGMPGWDGFETIRRLKDDARTRSIPVIFLSASTCSQDKARGLDLGAVDYVSKPFDPIELRARVRVALRTKSLHDLLEQRAHLDGLTGLKNRHALEERLTADWALCGRLRRPLAVIVADLDRFKRINDQHGHWAGDEVLRGAADVLRTAVRAADFVARLGGEEFVVVAPNCDLDGASVMAERFRTDLAALDFSFNGAAISVTASLGVAAALDPWNGEPTDVLCRADWAMYQAKTEGRNTVRAWGRSLVEQLV